MFETDDCNTARGRTAQTRSARRAILNSLASISKGVWSTSAPVNKQSWSFEFFQNKTHSFTMSSVSGISEYHPLSWKADGANMTALLSSTAAWVWCRHSFPCCESSTLDRKRHCEN